MTSQKQINKALIRARRTMAKRGMTKNVLWNSHGAVCLRGAIVLGSPAIFRAWNFTSPGRERDLLRDCELAMGFSPGYTHDLTNAADWNNLPSTTKEMVLERFEMGLRATQPRWQGRQVPAPRLTLVRPPIALVVPEDWELAPKEDREPVGA